MEEAFPYLRKKFAVSSDSIQPNEHLSWRKRLWKKIYSYVWDDDLTHSIQTTLNPEEVSRKYIVLLHSQYVCALTYLHSIVNLECYMARVSIYICVSQCIWVGVASGNRTHVCCVHLCCSIIPQNTDYRVDRLKSIVEILIKRNVEQEKKMEEKLIKEMDEKQEKLIKEMDERQDKMMEEMAKILKKIQEK